jgi:shikimate kinase
MPRLTLVGYRCSGKSAVASALARHLACSWTDADVALEHAAGMSITDLITIQGEPAFRDLESTVLRQLLESDPGVVATGGGVVLRETNRTLLKARARPVIWLTAPVSVIRERLAADPNSVTRRPSLTGGRAVDEVADALAIREPLYREVADGMIDTAADTPDRLASRIILWLDTERPEHIP